MKGQRSAPRHHSGHPVIKLRTVLEEEFDLSEHRKSFDKLSIGSDRHLKNTEPPSVYFLKFFSQHASENEGHAPSEGSSRSNSEAKHRTASPA